MIFKEPATVQAVFAAGDHAINSKKVDVKQAKAKPGKKSKNTFFYFAKLIKNLQAILFFMWQEIGCDLAPLQYLKRWKSLSQMTTLPTTDYAGSGGGATTLKTLSTLGTVFMQGVKNLVVKKHNLPITKIVDELMEVRENFYFNV